MLSKSALHAAHAQVQGAQATGGLGASEVKAVDNSQARSAYALRFIRFETKKKSGHMFQTTHLEKSDSKLLPHVVTEKVGFQTVFGTFWDLFETSSLRRPKALLNSACCSTAPIFSKASMLQSFISFIFCECGYFNIYQWLFFNNMVTKKHVKLSIVNICQHLIGT